MTVKKGKVLSNRDWRATGPREQPKSSQNRGKALGGGDSVLGRRCVVQDFGGAPLVAVIPAKNLSIRADHRGTERVCERAVLFRHEEAKELFHLRKFIGWRHGKFPVCKGRRLTASDPVIAVVA